VFCRQRNVVWKRNRNLWCNWRVCCDLFDCFLFSLPPRVFISFSPFRFLPASPLYALTYTFITHPFPSRRIQCERTFSEPTLYFVVIWRWNQVQPVLLADGISRSVLIFGIICGCIACIRFQPVLQSRNSDSLFRLRIIMAVEEGVRGSWPVFEMSCLRE
jgi:hypothetical protein